MTINNNNGNWGGSTTTTTGAIATFGSEPLNADSAVAFRAMVVARDSNGVIAVWHFEGAAKRASSGDAQVLSLRTGLHSADLGAERWSARVETSSSSLVFRVRGEDGATIDWSGQSNTREMYIT